LPIQLSQNQGDHQGVGLAEAADTSPVGVPEPLAGAGVA
jgi:hypothetical protein